MRYAQGHTVLAQSVVDEALAVATVEPDARDHLQRITTALEPLDERLQEALVSDGRKVVEGSQPGDEQIKVSIDLVNFVAAGSDVQCCRLHQAPVGHRPACGPVVQGLPHCGNLCSAGDMRETGGDRSAKAIDVRALQSLMNAHLHT